jgi:hypothetical protein
VNLVFHKRSQRSRLLAGFSEQSHRSLGTSGALGTYSATHQGLGD